MIDILNHAIGQGDAVGYAEEQGVVFVEVVNNRNRVTQSGGCSEGQGADQGERICARYAGAEIDAIGQRDGVAVAAEQTQTVREGIGQRDGVAVAEIAV